MTKLLESLTFLFSTIGACLLVSTCGYWLTKIYKFFEHISDDEQKKLIKDTIKEVNKK